jgi:hypothetical protein
MAYAGYREHFIGGTLKERRARKEEKFNDLLNFLVKETYSDTATLAQLLGISKQTTTAALKNLVDKELVMGVIIPVGGTKYWGITRRGILFAEQTIRGVGESANRKHFVPSMVNPVTIQHKLAIQKAIIYRESILKRAFKEDVVDAGQLNFENPYFYLLRNDVKQTPNFSKVKNKEKTVFPDSIFTLSQASGILAVAVEVELSIKAKARYKAIFTGHWQNQRQKSLYSVVIYVFETKKTAKSFRENILNPLIENTLEGDNFIEFLKNRVWLTSFESLENASRAA